MATVTPHMSALKVDPFKVVSDAIANHETEQVAAQLQMNAAGYRNHSTRY